MTSPFTSSTLSPVALSDSWSRTLSSPACNYRLSVAVPSSPAPAEGFPVLYLLDANAGFATVAETHRRLSRRPDATDVGPAVIVGIGHETDSLYDTALRHRDFTGPVSNPQRAAAGAKEGNAAEFLAFIEHQVKPLIGEAFPICTERQILVGHSLAGFFTLWVLANRPEAFAGYVALSPSLWWDPSLIDSIGGMALPSRLPRTFLAVGEWEEKLAPWQVGQEGSLEVLARRQQRRMVSNVENLGKILTERLGPPHAQCTVFPNEDHASVFTAGIGRAMRMML